MFNKHRDRNFLNRNYLTKHYNNLYVNSIEKLKQEFSISSSSSYYDPILQHPDKIQADKRYGITLIIRPPPALFPSIQRFLSDLRAVANEQYYYPNEDLHMTFLSIIPCHAFTLDQIDVADYVRTIGKILTTARPAAADDIQMNTEKKKKIQIHLKGITASISCVMIQGFVIEEYAAEEGNSEATERPESNAVTIDNNSNAPSNSCGSSNAINDLRDLTRTTFQEERSDLLLQPIDLRYTLTTAHFTVTRLSRPFENEEELLSYLAVLEQYRDYDFGSFEVEMIDLVGNDWYMSSCKVQLLHRFHL
jgi:hypothetical protein